MRVVWVAALSLSACEFHAGGDPSPDSGIVLPPGDHWITDTAAEFGATGFTASSIDIDPRGSLTPSGYLYGGLIVHGIHNVKLWDAPDVVFPWDHTIGVTPDGTATSTMAFWTTADSLTNLGIPTNDVFSLWFEGEVYLDANDVLAVNADNVGFIDLLLPTGWTEMCVAKVATVTSAPVTTAGWYPIRIGYEEGTASGFLDVRHGPPGSAVPFSRDRLRAAGSALRGTLRTTFAHQVFGGGPANGVAPVTRLETNPLLATLPPGPGTMNDWSARWFGQLYVTMPGMYTFHIASDDGSQLAVNGAQLATGWARDSIGMVGADLQMTLAGGWNDLALDYNQVSGSSSLSLSIVGGPDATLVGQLPLDRLRAVEPRGDRLAVHTVTATAISIPNNNATGATITNHIDGFSSELVTQLDVTARLSTQHVDQLVVSLQRPGGTAIVIQTHQGTGPLTNGYLHVATTDASLIGGVPAGDWLLTIVDDSAAANTSSLSEFHLTVHTQAGPEQIALAGTWTSAPFDAGAAPVEVVDVQWTERAAIASEIYLRACVMADCSDAPAWSIALAQHGAPSLPANRYLQAKVVMASDGTHEPELGELAVTYRAR